MNNQQFRRLVLENPSKTHEADNDSDSFTTVTSPHNDGVVSGPLLAVRPGPRTGLSAARRGTGRGSAASELFARQLKERRVQRRSLQQESHHASVAPRGTKLAAGYVDRAQELRNRANEERAGPGSNISISQRIQALEELARTGRIDGKTFTQLKEQILSVDQTATTQITKGLDRELLARARAGEDVFSELLEASSPHDEQAFSENVEVELDGILDQGVTAVEREKRNKRGVKANTSTAGRKRTRDSILRELKETRARDAEELKASRPALGAHFKKISTVPKPGTSQFVIDQHGREVLIVVDAQGNIKRKTRKQRQERDHDRAAHLSMPDNRANPLGMEVPLDLNASVVGKIESEDIFSDAGTEYNPFGDTHEDSGSDSTDQNHGDTDIGKSHRRSTGGEIKANETDDKPSGLLNPVQISQHQDYFAERSNEKNQRVGQNTDEDTSRSMFAMTKQILDTATKGDIAKSETQPNQQESESDRLARIRARIMEQDRDADDIDVGFSNSRFDEEDDDRQSTKFSRWWGDTTETNDDVLDSQQGRKRQDKRRRIKRVDSGKKTPNRL